MIKQNYGEFEITFDEREEKWTVDLEELGIRTNTSLAKLKEAIDRATTEKKKKVKKQSAIVESKYINYSYIHCTIGAEAELSHYSSAREFWIVDGKKERSKTTLNRLYADSPFNHEIITKIEELSAQIKALKSQQRELAASLEPFVPEEDLPVNQVKE